MLSKPVVLERTDDPGYWSVEQIDEPEGDIYLTIFYGPDSKERAREYAEFLKAKPDAPEQITT